MRKFVLKNHTVLFYITDRTSLNNLKYHFAEDGCSEVQYDLARQLLEENTGNNGGDEADTGPLESHIQGIHWLLCAAQQGHDGALILLTECYKTRRGINESNECEVHSCITMSPGERAARKAARELFACLSNGEEYITAAQLERRMREIYSMQKKKRKTSDSSLLSSSTVSSTPSTSDDENESKNDSTAAASTSQQQRSKRQRPSPLSRRLPRIDITQLNSELLSEANLVTAAINYSNGHLPPVSQALELSAPRPERLNHIPCFHRLLFHPIVFFSIFYHRFINGIASFPGNKISNIQLLLLLFIYTIFTSDNIVMFIPIGVYYLSLIVMLISSFKMLKVKNDFVDFRIWSGLFLSYGDENINAENSENQFLRNNLKPYLFFFFSFIVNLMLYPIISDQWISYSEITVISFLLTFLTMFVFMFSSNYHVPDYTILISFGINVLAKYPYEMDKVVITGWRFLDLKVPTFSTFVLGNGIEFCLNCRGLLYLMIPGFLLYLSHRGGSWRGTYQYLIPHCVTLSWLQICIVSSQYATMFGLVRAALGLAGLLLFLPLFGIVTLLLPIFAALEWLSFTDPTVRLYASIIAAVFALICSCVMAANRRTEKYITFLQISVCIVATVFLTLPYMTSNFDVAHSQYDSIIRRKTADAHHGGHDETFRNTLSWDTYYQYCHQPAWTHTNKVKTQIRCTQLDNTIVKWEGNVADVEISRIRNFRADLIRNYLPTFFGESLICLYGEKNTVACDEKEDCEGIRTFLNDQKKCNLNKWNSYDYEITVRMPSGLLTKPHEVILNADNLFSNLTLRLQTSDRIWFKGVLKNLHSSKYYPDSVRLGKERPIISLQSIGCVTCKDQDIEPVRMTDGLKIDARIRDLTRGVKYLLNVLFNPVLTFK